MLISAGCYLLLIPTSFALLGMGSAKRRTTVGVRAAERVA